MAKDQYYEQVGSDEGESLMREGEKVTRAPPTEPAKRTILTKIAIGAVVVTVFLAAVALVSSIIVSYRLPAAAEAAIEKAQAEHSTTDLTTPGTGSSDKLTDGSSASSSNDALSDPSLTPEDFSFLPKQEMRSCGSTPDEARAAGCVFDVMMQLWTPPECMDTNLSERYLAKGNWTWYANADASKIYDDEEIRKGDHDVVYVAQSYHRHHCIFAWERVVRALRNQAPLIEELISYDHVMHCRYRTLTLPEEGAEEVRGVVAPTGYTKCASYDVWIKNLPYNKMSSVE